MSINRIQIIKFLAKFGTQSHGPAVSTWSCSHFAPKLFCIFIIHITELILSILDYQLTYFNRKFTTLMFPRRMSLFLRRRRPYKWSYIQGGPKKPDHFWKYVTPAHDDVGRRSIYQNVQLLIRSKTGFLYGAIFKYSLHKCKETTSHRKYQLI